MSTISKTKYVVAKDIEEALAMLGNIEENFIPIAGATWVMRASIRREKTTQAFVDLSSIAALRAITIDDKQLSIGSLATHEQIAKAISGHKDLAALAIAATNSATPAIRRVATVGGNISTVNFAQADLVPALLALDSKVEIQEPNGSTIIPFSKFLDVRSSRNPARIVTRILVPRTDRTTSHARLTLRKAGEYPVALVSVSIAQDTGGTITDACVAVGAVEPIARRWTRFERAILGRKPTAPEVQDLAKTCVDEFIGRDGVDAPGWYRLRVLPSLAGKAFKLMQQN